MLMSRRALGAVTALSIAALPSTALAAKTHHTTKPSKAAVAACKAERKKLGKAAFDKKYGAKNAMGKCESAWAKHHGKTKK